MPIFQCNEVAILIQNSIGTAFRFQRNNCHKEFECCGKLWQLHRFRKMQSMKFEWYQEETDHSDNSGHFPLQSKSEELRIRRMHLHKSSLVMQEYQSIEVMNILEKQIFQFEWVSILIQNWYSPGRRKSKINHLQLSQLIESRLSQVGNRNKESVWTEWHQSENLQ
jgi:hypothetical protein